MMRAMRQWRYVAGLGLDGLGFLLELVALRSLPIYVVGAALAASLAVTAVVASWALRVRLSRVEWLAVGTVCGGLAMLGLASGAEGAGTGSMALRVGGAVHGGGRLPVRRGRGLAAGPGPRGGAGPGGRASASGWWRCPSAWSTASRPARCWPTPPRTPCCSAASPASCS
ncbi:hypothetical protein GCM10020000_31710 [Streptomyces olivoverticillatus]